MKRRPFGRFGEPRIPWPVHLLRLVLPIGLQFASFGLLWISMAALCDLAGIPWDGPLKEQPYGWACFVAFIVEMLLLMFTGFTTGRVLVASIQHRWYGRSWERLAETGDLPEFLVLLFQDSGARLAPTRDGEPRENSLYDPDLDDAVRPQPDPVP